MSTSGQDESTEESLLQHLNSDDHREVPEDERDWLSRHDQHARSADTLEPEDIDPVRMRVVGAWGGSAMRANPEFWVDFAKALRLNRIDLMVNDHSRARTCDGKFPHATAKEIARVAHLCREAQIELHLTSWILPCKSYIESEAEFLLPVMRDENVSSLVWDAEEPWTQTRGDLTHADAGNLVGELFSSVQVAVSAITYCDCAKIKPLADRAQLLIPQAYATDKKGMDARKLVSIAYTRWKREFGRAPTIMGLAAYHMNGEPLRRMQEAVEATASYGIDTVCYWSLFNIRDNPAVAKFVAKLRG